MESRNVHRFDLNSFSQGDYLKAMRDFTEAELITKFFTQRMIIRERIALETTILLGQCSIQNIISDHIRIMGHSFIP
jgi:hypothetical protein